MSIGAFMWVVTAASIVGTVANIYKKQWCFWIWGVTNAAWVAYDFHIGAWAQAVLMGIYSLLAIWGIIAWRKN